MNNDNFNNGGQTQNNINPVMEGMEPQNNMNLGMVQPTAQKPMNLPLIIGVAAVALIVLVVIVLFATGIIGGKTLTCTTEGTIMGMTMTEELKITFNGDTANKVVGKMTIVSIYKDYLEESFNELIDDFKEDGIDAKLTSDDDSMTLTVIAKKGNLESVLGIDEDDGNTYDELKEYYEADGYTCK